MELMCTATRGGTVDGWVPAALVDALSLGARATPHARRALLAWLGVVRTTTEDYEPCARAPPPPPPDPFDDILGSIGREIFQLELYQRRFGSPSGGSEIDGSIVELFDGCIDEMARADPAPDRADSSSATFETAAGSPTDDVSDGTSVYSEDAAGPSQPRETPSGEVDEPARAPPAVPPRRSLRRSTLSSESLYANMDRPTDKPRPLSNVESLKSRLDSDSDASATDWRYRPGSRRSVEGEYAPVWTCSSGFRDSDDVLYRVLRQHRALERSISFDTVGELAPDEYSLYALPLDAAPEGAGESGARSPQCGPATHARSDAGYATVMQPENIYEEIDARLRLGAEDSSHDSVEIVSCSSSERCASPEYVNLRDFSAYVITEDVIYWKNLLLLPDYNEDEEDEWITPEESFSYGQERRPPYIIPRITSYRVPPYNRPTDFAQDLFPGSPGKVKLAESAGRVQDWSPVSDRGLFDSASDISAKRLGSNENFHRHLDDFGSRTELHNLRRAKALSTTERSARSPVPLPRSKLNVFGHTDVIFEGKVKRTRVSESGKKQRKNWTENHLVLTNSHLLFYKDEKAYQAVQKTPPSPTGGARAADLSVPLHGASVCMCTLEHTKRFAKALMVTLGANQMLIKDDSAAGAMYWYEVISKAIAHAPPESLLISEHAGSSGSMTRSTGKKAGDSTDDHSDHIDQTKVQKRLKKLLNRRPTREQLIKKGVYKDEPVFGRSLEEVCRAESPRVPEFVERCVREIESSEENLHADGLYRASGNLSQVQKIRLQIDQNNMSIVEQNPDVHVLAGSLKLFFRELKEPLVPCKLFNRTLAATGIKNREERIKEFRELVNSLPQCNYDTLKFLLQHLLRVTEHSAKNRMHISNLAIVFGPTLLWAPPELQHNIATDCIQQNHAIEILLTDFHEIFVRERWRKV